jgi:hypothetical protein
METSVNFLSYVNQYFTLFSPICLVGLRETSIRKSVSCLTLYHVDWRDLQRENFTCPCENTVFCFLSGIASEIPPSPETLVGWLLEHPDHALCNSDTVSSFDGLSDTDSISEEVEDMTASHTEGVILTFNIHLVYQMF